MHEETSPISGFKPIEASWRLLQLRGVTKNFHRLKEMYTVNNTPESIVLLLGSAGIQARLAKFLAKEASYLKTPTLLQIVDGTWVILKKFEKKGLLIEGSTGMQWLSLEMISERLSGTALDLSLSMPNEVTLWASLKILLSHEKGVLARIGIATIMMMILALVLPEFTGLALNQALPNGAWSTLKLITTGVLLVSIFQALIGWMRESSLLYIATRLETTAERGFLDYILKLPFSFLQRRTLGDMLQACGSLAATRELLAERILGVILDSTMAVFFLIMMGFKIFAPTAAVLLVATAMVGIAILIGRSQAKLQALEVEAQAKTQGYLAEIITGISTLKAAGAERQGLFRWMDRFKTELFLNLRKSRLNLWSEVGLTTLQQATTALLLVWGGSLVLNGEIKVGTLFAFIQLSSGFLGAVSGVISACMIYLLLKRQLIKVNEFLNEPSEDHDQAFLNSHQLPKGPVIMKDVWFRYTSDGPWVLKGYNLRVESGEKFTLTGPSGYGKTTILRLLAGLYAPEKGIIRIGELSPKLIRQNILYLPQSIQLLGGSIWDNLRIFSNDAPTERILDVSKQTGLQDLTNSLPMGYNTILSHGGLSLSGGQRQLIALTGALASGREILVLDEATANLDGLSGERICLLLNKTRCTIISTTHALETRQNVALPHSATP